MYEISYPIAFSAGVLSFFAPCVLPLLPAYIGYITGVSTKELWEKGYAPYVKKMLTSSLFYILGFSLVFVILGTTAAGLGITFRRYDFFIRRIGGLVILILGLEFAGILRVPFLEKERKFKLPLWADRLGYLRAFFVGLVFAFAWTPCVGVILGTILALAAVSGTAVQGASLLFTYSLGISLPFIIVSLTLASAPRYLKFMNKYIGKIARTAGLILALLGLLLLTDTYKYLNAWLFEVFFRFGYQIR